jgi:hypothetical protein
MAVLRLLLWCEQNADLDAKLPLLATYLEHVGLASSRFRGILAVGLTRFHGPGSEPSPTFTELSASSCIDRRRRWKSPASVYADGRRGPTYRVAQARSATQRANSIGWGDGSPMALRESQTVLNIPS